MFSSKDTVEPPAELESFDARISVETLWSDDIGVGSEEKRLRLVPSVSGGRVFAADADGVVTARDANTGKALWTQKTKLPVAAGPGTGSGRVLVGTIDGTVLALDAEDGKELWRSELNSEILAVPAIGYGTVVVRGIDGSMAGLDAIDGHRKWGYATSVPVLTLRGASSPLIDGGAAIAGFSNGKLVSVDLLDGRVKWEMNVATPKGRSELERMVDIDGDPVLAGGVVYVVTYQGNLAAVSSATGVALWQRAFSSYAGLGADDGQHLYVTDDSDHVWAIEAQTGAALWKQEKLHGRQLTAPAVVGDFVVVGDFEGYLHWLSREDGSFVGRNRVDRDGLSAQPVVVDGVVFAYGNGGDLAALRPKIKENP